VALARPSPCQPTQGRHLARSAIIRGPTYGVNFPCVFRPSGLTSLSSRYPIMADTPWRNGLCVR